MSISRYREIDNRKTTPIVVIDTPPGSIIYQSTTESGFHATCSDTVTPGYRKRIRKGEIICRPIELHKGTRSSQVCTIIAGPHGQWGTREITGDIADMLYGGLCADLNPTPADVPNMRANALIKAYAKIDESAIMGLVNLKELGQTLGMLTHPLESLVALTSKMIKRKKILKRDGLSAMKATANTWLEYRYAWYPSVADIGNIIERIETDKVVNARHSRFIARGVVKSPLRKFSARVTDALTLGNFRATYDRSLETKTTVSAGVIYSVVDESASRNIAAKCGLRLQDIPAALWEVVPWSFAVDWFVGVGDWVQAVTPKPNSIIMDNWVTEVTEEVHSISDIKMSISVSSMPDGTPAKTYTFYVPGGSNQTYRYVRSTSQSLPSTPVLSHNFSVLHQVDSVALLAGQVVNGLKQFARS